MPGREIFTALTEAKVLIEQWKREYNQIAHLALWATGHLHILLVCERKPPAKDLAAIGSSLLSANKRAV